MGDLCVEFEAEDVGPGQEAKSRPAAFHGADRFFEGVEDVEGPGFEESSHDVIRDLFAVDADFVFAANEAQGPGGVTEIAAPWVFELNGIFANVGGADELVSKVVDVVAHDEAEVGVFENAIIDEVLKGFVLALVDVSDLLASAVFDDVFAFEEVAEELFDAADLFEDEHAVFAKGGATALGLCGSGQSGVGRCWVFVDAWDDFAVEDFFGGGASCDAFGVGVKRELNFVGGVGVGRLVLFVGFDVGPESGDFGFHGFAFEALVNELFDGVPFVAFDDAVAVGVELSADLGVGEDELSHAFEFGLKAFRVDGHWGGLA